LRSAALALAVCCAALALPNGAAAAFAPLGQYGSGSSGAGAGQLAGPTGVAADGAGNLYVADNGNHRVSQFTTSGAFLRAWGWGVGPGAGAVQVCTPATTSEHGTPGGGAGQLNNPYGIADDGAGNLYVVSQNDPRVNQFTASGDFVRAWGWGVDTGAAAFEVCTAATTCQPGIAGGGAGQLAAPSGVVADGSGNLYVGDADNQRVSQFTASGAFVRAWGWGVDTGAPAFEVCTAATTCQPGLLGGGAGQLWFPIGVAADGAGNLYVAESGGHRVSQFTASGAFVRAWGWGVDTGAAAFEVCTAATTCQQGLAGGGAGQLAGPNGVAADGAGNLYVAEQTNHRVSQFTGSGAFIRAWGSDVIPGGPSGFEVCTALTGCKEAISGAGAGQLFNPFLVDTDCRGNVYVADTSNHRIQRFGEEGTALAPCPPPTPPQPPAPPQPAAQLPSNDFEFDKVQLNKKKGVAFLTVFLPGPGDIGLSGKGLAGVPLSSVTASREVAAAGPVKLKVKPGKKGKRARKVRQALRRKGKAVVKVLVTYVPRGGFANTQVRRVKLLSK